MTGPVYDCTWPVSYAQCASPDLIGNLSVTDKAMFEAMATEFLWNWTGQVFGVCPVTIRPCRLDCDPASTFWGSGPYPWGSSPWQPVLIGGRMFNLTCGTCAGSCGCGTEPAALTLPGPVVAVEAVTLDGQLMDPAGWVLDGRNLHRVDGGHWPTCQNMTLPPTEPGTWQVTYDRGVPVPAGGQVAAGVLTVELAKAACRDQSCALPQRIQSITRQGVTVAVLDSFDDIDTGHTGIFLIDSWVASVTKSKRAQGGRVYSPDLRPAGRMGSVPPPPPVPL